MKNEIMKNDSTKNTITTIEIAEMLGMKHYKILEKLDGTKDGKTKGIIDILTHHDFVVSDYFIPSTYKDASGKENKCYLVTKLGCDFLANKFTGEKGILFTAKYVKRFDEMEQTIKNPFNLPTTYKEALVQLLEKVEENEKLMIENAEMKPKAAFHDAVSIAENCISFGKFASTFQNNNKVSFGRNKIMDWCRDRDYLCSSHSLKNKPSQQMIDSGYMKYKQNTNNRDGKEYITYTPLLTGKGEIWLTRKLLNYFKK